MAVLDLYEELIAVTRALDASAVNYALCGGIAVGIHGAPRFTKDIDLLVPQEDVERAKGVAKACGFRAESLPMRFAATDTTMHRVIKLSGADLLMLDLLLVTEATRLAFDSRERLSFGSASAWVLGRQALIAMKIGAGRPQDLLDVARLSEQD
jgi:hypothetical protein